MQPAAPEELQGIRCPLNNENATYEFVHLFLGPLISYAALEQEARHNADDKELLYTINHDAELKARSSRDTETIMLRRFYYHKYKFDDGLGDRNPKKPEKWNILVVKDLKVPDLHCATNGHLALFHLPSDTKDRFTWYLRCTDMPLAVSLANRNWREERAREDMLKKKADRKEREKKLKAAVDADLDQHLLKIYKQPPAKPALEACLAKKSWTPSQFIPTCLRHALGLSNSLRSSRETRAMLNSTATQIHKTTTSNLASSPPPKSPALRQNL